MVTIDVERFEAFLFDLDGVITQTASVHARAWQRTFDEFLTQQAEQTGAAFVPFDTDTDYRRYVDGKPRLAGILSFLAARGINLPMGEPGDLPECATVHGIAARKDRYFVELLTREGVQVFPSAPIFLHEARRRGLRLAVASSSHHCSEILRAARLTALFDVRVDGIELDRLGLSGKPAPDMFLEAARRLDSPPMRIAVFEDATAGVAAARAGGFGLVVGIGRNVQAKVLLESGADQVIADLSEMRLQGSSDRLRMRRRRQVLQDFRTRDKSMNGPELGLVGDVGATYARFALVASDGSTAAPKVYALDDYPSIADAMESFLAGGSSVKQPTQAVLAVAAPMTGDQVTLTNHSWTFSIEGLRRRLGLERLRVINDFAANALAVPHFREGDRTQIGSGAPIADAPIGVIGPGTGLGVSALVSIGDGTVPIQSEGGHVTMAPADEREGAVLDLMRRRYDHVSAERVLSGPGLINLYNALCELSGVPAKPFTAPQITSPQVGEEDPRAWEATAMFCAMLGTVAGNLALTFGARGGIYIAGGIVPRLGAVFAQSAFRARFEAKGRFTSYLAAIPTYVITRPLPALLGAAKLLESP